MADEAREEDEWIYGESDQLKVEPEVEQSLEGEPGELVDKGQLNQAGQNAGVVGEANEGDSDDEDDDDDDSDDDGVQVVIGDIKAGQSTFAQSTTKRTGPPPDKKGKFSVEDFESSGTINGVPAQDFSLDSLEEKPWRKPGADITDYFNYGFTEDTWRAYCDRQKRLRFESGTNLPSMINQGKHQQQDSRGLIPVAISNDNSKYAGQSNIVFPKKFGIQGPGRKEDLMVRRREEPKENTIQVMTADRREYSRKAFDMPPPIPPPFDMSVPPPSFPPPDAYLGGAPEFFNPHQPPPQFYHEEHGGDYEEQNWMDSSWNMEMGMPGGPGASSSVVSLTKAAVVPPPPGESIEDGGSSSSSSKEDKKTKSEK